jgi:arylsulfatase A
MKPSTNLILLTSAAAGLAACVGESRGDSKSPRDLSDSKPNIILIMADDMGYECLGTYGSAEYETTNLNKMAQQGIQCNHCYAQPLCTPSRVKIMTGKYNARNYVDFGYLDPDEKTFGNLLKEAGYKTCIAGKWQLNGAYHKDKYNWDDLDKPHKFGFDEYCLWQLHIKRSKNTERFANPVITQNGKTLDKELDGKYGPQVFCDYITNFIEENKDTSFFVYFPMVLVHDPFVPTPDSPEWTDTALWYAKDTSLFADMMNYTDKIVGQINKKLEELGLAENTIVMFTGDNGTHPTIWSDMTDGRKIQGGKGSMADRGTRVPFIIYQKNRYKDPIVSDALIDFSDFLPTLSDIAKFELPTNYQTDGTSFYPIYQGKEFKGKDMFYMFYNPKWGKWREDKEFVRNRTYKLYRSGEFYNVEKDVMEENPIADACLTEEEKAVKEKLQAGFFKRN